MSGFSIPGIKPPPDPFAPPPKPKRPKRGRPPRQPPPVYPDTAEWLKAFDKLLARNPDWCITHESLDEDTGRLFFQLSWEPIPNRDVGRPPRFCFTCGYDKEHGLETWPRKSKMSDYIRCNTGLPKP